MSTTNEKTVKMMSHRGPGGLVALLTYIGAAVYFVQKAGDGFWDVVLALLQAMVWPAYLVFHILKALGA
jgi:hypothetical protein